MKQQRYTLEYSRRSIATITVTATSDEEAQQKAVELLELQHSEARETDIEVEFLNVKEVEPEGPDRSEDDV